MSTLTNTTLHPEIRAITGLRAIAVWWVLLFHLKFFIIAVFPQATVAIRILASAGNLGVDLFFVISGFIISYRYHDFFYPFAWKNYFLYLQNRLARIYPIHLVMLLLIGISVGLIEPGASIWYVVGPRFKVEFTQATFWQNLFMVQAWFPPVNRSWSFFSWSISCEWFAYLFFPIFILLINILHSSSKLALFSLSSLIVFGIYCHLVAYQTDLTYGVIRVIPEFLAGCVLFKLYQQHAFAHLPWDKISLYATFAAIFGGGFLSYCYHLSVIDFLPIILPFIVYGVLFGGLWSEWLSNRFMNFWGKVSYSLYMSSCVSIYCLSKIFPIQQLIVTSMANGVVILFIYLVVILGAGAGCYWLIEEPLRKCLKDDKKL